MSVEKLTDYTLNAFVSLKADKEEAQKTKNFFEKWASSFGNTFKNYFENIPGKWGIKMASTIMSLGQTLVNTFKNAWKEIEDIASFSRLTNENTRELAFNYGLTGGQAYGYEQAQKMLGFGLEEMPYASEYERNKFQEVMEKYAERYNELYDQGFFDEYLDFQIEWQEFKQDFLMEFVKIIMDNKEIIIGAMHAIISILGVVMDILHALGIGRVQESERQAYASNSQILNYNTNTRGNTSFNVKFDNTFNNVSTKDQVALQNIGDMTFQQFTEALKVYSD